MKAQKQKELIENAIEHIFKNTERIYGNSKAIDWIKVAASKSATYLLESELSSLNETPEAQGAEEMSTKQWIIDNLGYNYLKPGYSGWSVGMTAITALDEIKNAMKKHINQHREPALTDEEIEEAFPCNIRILIKQLKIPVSAEMSEVLKAIQKANLNKELGAKWARNKLTGK